MAVDRGDLSLDLIGHYNVSNLLGVIGAMRAMGVPLARAVRACGRLLPVPGRMERLAVAGQLVTILVVHFALRITLPLPEMLTLLGALAAFNIACWLRSRTAGRVSDTELLCGLLVDVLTLSAQLFYAGGVTNPFIFLDLLQVAVASVLLRPTYTWTVVGFTSLCFAALTQWYRPLAMTGLDVAALSVPYIGGLLLCFLLNAGLLVTFIVRIERNLRRRDARLARRAAAAGRARLPGRHRLRAHPPRHRPHPLRPVGDEELQPQLQPADMRSDPPRRALLGTHEVRGAHHQPRDRHGRILDRPRERTDLIEAARRERHDAVVRIPPVRWAQAADAAHRGRDGRAGP